MGERWEPRPPAPGRPLDGFPPCDPGEPPDLRRVSLRGTRLSTAVLADGAQLVDVSIADCDIAGLVAHKARVERAVLRATRLRAVAWAAGIVRDVVVEDVVATELSMRFSRLHRVVLRDCDLRGADFAGASFDRVLVERCDLRGARFDQASVDQLRIASSDLTGVTGAAGLRGASVHPDVLLSLAQSLAVAVGVTVE